MSKLSLFSEPKKGTGDKVTSTTLLKELFKSEVETHKRLEESDREIYERLDGIATKLDKLLSERSKTNELLLDINREIIEMVAMGMEDLKKNTQAINDHLSAFEERLDKRDSVDDAKRSVQELKSLVTQHSDEMDLLMRGLQKRIDAFESRASVGTAPTRLAMDEDLEDIVGGLTNGVESE